MGTERASSTDRPLEEHAVREPRSIDIAPSEIAVVRRSDADEPRSLFILGPARSGTSLLYKTLCLHPETAWISNWVARFPRRPSLASLNRLARRMPARARRAWFDASSNAYVYGTRRRILDRLFPMPVEGEPVYRASGIDGAEPGAGAGSDRLLRRTFRSIASFGGGEVFVSKRIANNSRIPLLARAFPSARFLVMARDGRAVAHSLSKVDWWPTTVLPWAGGTPAAWEAAGGDPWELCARNWVEDVRSIEAGLVSVPEERIMRVRYETLVRDPSATLDAVARFASLEPVPRWRASLSAISFADRNASWRRELAPSAVATITAVQGGLLDELGYGDGAPPW